MSDAKDRDEERAAKEARLRKARRDALKRIAGLGVALVAPSALLACGGDDHPYSSISYYSHGYSSHSYSSGSYYSGSYYSHSAYSSSAYSSSAYSSSAYSSHSTYHDYCYYSGGDYYSYDDCCYYSCS